MKKLCLCLSAAAAILQIHAAAPGSPEDYAQGKQRLEEMRQVKRTPVLERPHFFIRSQTKYSGRLYHCNYYHDDRPLFADRRLWSDNGSDHTLASFRKTFELYRLYDLDGYATFAPPGELEYKRVLKVLYDAAAELKLDPKSFNIMLEIAPDNPRVSYSQMAPETLALITDNPFSFRIGNQSVISSYTMDRLTPEELGKQVEALRKTSGGKIMFLPQMILVNLEDTRGRRLNGHDLYQVYRAHQTLPHSIIQRLEEYLRSYLEVCDGIYLGHFSTRMDDSFDETFTNDVLIPVVNSVLAEPKYNGRKLFGVIAKAGYSSYYGAQNLSRDGTRTLRNFLEGAIRFRPDLIIGTEWDELNEDTGFQPLACKPMSNQRVIRYYMSQFKAIAPTPNPGDDLSIPNLIVSQRRQLIPGEIMKVEVLNVPDTAAGEKYRAVLELTDENGKVIYGPETMEFNTAELKECVFAPPGEQFAAQRVLRPRLTVTYRDQTRIFYTGLPFTTIQPTVSGDVQYFSTPLRNILIPSSEQITISDTGVACALDVPEKLLSVEVMQNQLEHFAYDLRDEYRRNDASRKFFQLTYQYLNNPTPPRLATKIDFKVTGAPSLIAFDPSENPSETAQVLKQIPSYTGQINRWKRAAFFSIATADLPNAVVRVEGIRASGKLKDQKFTWEVPLKDLVGPGVTAKVFEDGVTLGLEMDGRPGIIPLPPDTNRVEFQREINFNQPDAAIALRAISESGKVYWSAPHVLKRPTDATPRSVFVYSNSAKKTVKLELPADRVPDVVYDFTPRYGNVLTTPAGRGFYAMIGSYQSVATGFIGLEGSYAPFHFFNKQIFKEADKPVPEWVYEDGRHALRFDGERGNFIMFPNLVVPQRAGYTIIFDVKPEEVKSEQVLFAHQAIQKSGLILSVRDGNFHITYDHRNWRTGKFGQHKIATKVPLLAGKWQTVKLAYDGSKISISANGQSQSFPMQGTGIFIQSSHFGGRGERTKDGTIPFYKGLLGSFEVKHWVE